MDPLLLAHSAELTGPWAVIMAVGFLIALPLVAFLILKYRSEVKRERLRRDDPDEFHRTADAEKNF